MAGRACSSTTPTTRHRPTSGSCRSPRHRADDRPHRRHVPPHLAHQPRRVKPGEVPAHLSRSQADGDGPLDLTDHALRVLEALGIDALIPIGGDDTLSYALRLHDEGVPVVAIPKTMDNDVHGTDYCIGFSTAVTRGVQFIHHLRTIAGSHERIAVVELFGRYSGETSLVSAYLAGVDRAVISEVPFDIDRLAGCSWPTSAQTRRTTRC